VYICDVSLKFSQIERRLGDSCAQGRSRADFNSLVLILPMGFFHSASKFLNLNVSSSK
jgi:hypothetical protein